MTCARASSRSFVDRSTCQRGDINIDSRKVETNWQWAHFALQISELVGQPTVVRWLGFDLINEVLVQALKPGDRGGLGLKLVLQAIQLRRRLGHTIPFSAEALLELRDLLLVLPVLQREGGR